MIIEQPVLPGIGPEECTDGHDLRPARLPGWGKLWKRCSRCHLGVFTVRPRRKR